MGCHWCLGIDSHFVMISTRAKSVRISFIFAISVFIELELATIDVNNLQTVNITVSPSTESAFILLVCIYSINASDQPPLQFGIRLGQPLWKTVRVHLHPPTTLFCLNGYRSGWTINVYHNHVEFPQKIFCSRNPVWVALSNLQSIAIRGVVACQILSTIESRMPAYRETEVTVSSSHPTMSRVL